MVASEQIIAKISSKELVSPKESPSAAPSSALMTRKREKSKEVCARTSRKADGFVSKNAGSVSGAKFPERVALKRVKQLGKG
jgi:hypothetical protein